MKKNKILFISQEITPYLPETEMSKIGRILPQGIQEKGKEIRTFMPKYGCINERRNQLHEVIRLSGMNLIINDTDHPLIIKVASIQSARMQVYSILQLRLHKTICALKERVETGPADKIYDIDLTYITSRGKWYYASWKGDVRKSGGIATNIGVHFYDMLTWVFGPVKKNVVHVSAADRVASHRIFR